MNYYRNAGSIVYHIPADNWVRSGKSKCGRNISKPGFVYNPAKQDYKVRVICRDCNKVA